jgi:uracil-DNA glycosylase family 4
MAANDPPTLTTRMRNAELSAPERYSGDCTRCPRLARHLATVREQFPGYHARPVSAFGDVAARLAVVGLAPGLHGANRTGRPFTGDHAGILLYETLYRFGYANRAEALTPGDGLRLSGCFITNAVKCLPPQNKPCSDEIARCNGYLRDELSILAPGSAILALGAIAHHAVLMAEQVVPRAKYRFAHGARHLLPSGRVLFDSYHCSRYNTQTRRLTAAMFRQIFSAISKHLNRR